MGRIRLRLAKTGKGHWSEWRCSISETVQISTSTGTPNGRGSFTSCDSADRAGRHVVGKRMAPLARAQETGALYIYVISERKCTMSTFPRCMVGLQADVAALLDRFVPARRRHPRYTPLAVVSDAAIKAVGVSSFADDASDVAWLKDTADASAGDWRVNQQAEGDGFLCAVNSDDAP